MQSIRWGSFLVVVLLVSICLAVIACGSTTKQVRPSGPCPGEACLTQPLATETP
jgi:hypothetical protein